MDLYDLFASANYSVASKETEYKEDRKAFWQMTELSLFFLIEN